jgi:hypothetical protein
LVLLKKVDNSDPGTTDQIGGNDWDKLADYFNNTDVSETPTINNDTLYRQDKLQIRNSANTFGHKVRSAATAARTITYPDSDVLLSQTPRQAYKYYIYLDSSDNKFKAKNGVTGAIDYISTDATDAQPVIQSAINGNSNAPGIIELASNTLFPMLSFNGSGGSARHLILRTGQWFRGGGWTTILKGAGGTTAYPINATDVSDLRISNMTIDGNNTDGHTQASASVSVGNIYIAGTANSRVMVDGVKCINAVRQGMKFAACGHVFAHNNYCEITALLDTGVGLSAIHSTDFTKYISYIGNHIKNSGGPALGCNGQGGQNQQYVVIMGNVVENSNPSGLLYSPTGGRGQILTESDTAIPPQDERILITNNTVLANYRAITCISPSNVVIANNVFANTGYTTTIDDGLSAMISLTGQASKSVNIHDNLILDAALDGIVISQAGGRVSIHHNHIINPGCKNSAALKDGIWIAASSGNTINMVNITDNTIVDDRGSPLMEYGVRIQTSGTGVISNLVLEDNLISGHTAARYNIIGTGETYRRRRSTTVLNGGSATINIPHKLSATPNLESIYVTPLSANARGSFHVTADSTNIILNYTAATTSGTNNLTYAWRASVD